MVKLLACGARGSWFDSQSRSTISEIGYLLLSSRDIAEISLKGRDSSKEPTNKQSDIVQLQ